MGDNDVLKMLNDEKQRTLQTAMESNVTKDSKQEDFQDSRTFLYDALSDEEANRVLNNPRHRLVVLLGLPLSGKSTFVGSMYHMLMTKVSMGNYRLLGSDTYVGLERRVYLRYAHGHNISDTKRTGNLEGHILTLDLEEKNRLEKLQLFLSDRTGERYKKYASGEANMKDDASLLSADHLYIFVAADMLTGNEYLSVKEKYVKLATQLRTVGVIERAKTVTLIFNKIDLVMNDKDRFERKKQLFLTAMKEAVNLVGLDSYNVQSNNMNAMELKIMIEKLIGNAFDNQDNNDEEKLDWMNKEIQKYQEL